MVGRPELIPVDGASPQPFVSPQNVEAGQAVVEGDGWGATIRNIEGDQGGPLKRTTMMWGGVGWHAREFLPEDGSIHRRAVIGPLVENTAKDPFFVLKLDAFRLNVEKDGGVSGSEVESSGVLYWPATPEPSLGRNAALDQALSFCTEEFGGGGDLLDSENPAPLVGNEARQGESNLAKVNRIVALAFLGPESQPVKTAPAAVAGMRANLAMSLCQQDFVGVPTAVSVSLGREASISDLETLRDFIGDLPVVVPIEHRHCLVPLNLLFKRAKLQELSVSGRYSVAVSGIAKGLAIEDIAKSTLEAAGVRKRIDSGWVAMQRPVL